MYRLTRTLGFIFGLFLAFSLRADPGPMSISFTYPGVPGLDGPNNAPGVDKSWWTTALPVGNGKLAAMVYGGVGYELIQFNEDTIWTGQPHDYSNPAATSNHLATIQTECFNGQDIATDAGNWLIATPSRLPEYQCPGALMLTFPHSGTANYLRSLNLSNATVNVHYDYGGVTYNRDIFASAPSNRVIVVHFTTPNNSSTITFACTLTNHQTATYSTSGNDLIMHARVSTRGDDRYFTTPALGLTNGVQYDARVRMVATGGTVTVGTSSLSVTNATDVTLYLSVASNVKAYNDLTADYVTICSNNVANAAALGYTAVRQAQQSDYKNLFNRVVLDLGVNSTRTSYDLGYRKKLMGSDPNDPNLVALFFQMGRYLMISGSRPGSQPLTLQGKWNDMTNMYSLWGSKMTLNINEEMNYWGAEVANLSECTLPLFDLIKELSVTGNKVALGTYFCTNNDPTLTNAWVAHHNTDLWRNAAPVNGWDGYWPSGGAWLCQHLWWHYQYTGDTAWLRTNAYPLMKGAVQFFQGFLRPIPTGSIYYSTTSSNWMVTCPSMSPEHNDPAGHANCPSPTMDNDLIRELFDDFTNACQILNTDATLRASITALRAQLPPDVVGTSGQLREFLNYEDNDTGHRHCSGLVGLFPGEEISPFYTPILAQAAKVAVDLRGDSTSDTPWSRAMRLNLHTRVQDGERAFLSLTNILGGSKVSTNLVFGDGSDGSNRQLDFIFGSLSGVAEMFLQSQSGEVFLLPALPSRFTNGAVSGLCARGGFEVDNMSWTNGKLAGATILSKLGNTCRLRSKWPVDVMLGSNYVAAPMVLPGLYQFSTTAGNNYTVVPALVAETENLSASISAGDTHQVVTNAALSNSRGTLLTANASGDFVTYTISNLVTGNYHVRIGANAGANGGRFQLACGAGSTMANVGTVQDLYSPTNVAYLLPLRLSTSTNLITLWTNLQQELDCGTWQVPSNGNYKFQFTVTGKNAGSSGFNLPLDYIKLTPELITGPDNAPTGISLSTSSMAENQPSGTAVGTFSTTDPDNGDTFTYALVSGTGSTDNGSFAITNNTLYTAAAFNFEGQNSYSIRVQSTDSGGLSVSNTFSITMTNINETPTDISLSNSSVAENQPSGTAVGTLSSADPDSGDTFTYALVGGTGSTDNGLFTITNDTLYTAAVFDYEGQNSYSIRVRTTDQGGLPIEKIFTITVTDANDAPIDVALSNSTVAENQPANTPIGAFSSTDPDSGNTFTYSLVNGAGSTDNGAFAISGNTLQTAAIFNFEAQNSYSIRVRTTDQGSLYFEKIFTITVTDLNEAPATPTNLVPVDGAADQPPGLTLQASAFSDPDGGDTHLASQWLIQRASDSTLVFDSGEDLTNKTSLTAPSGALEYVTAYNWQVRYEDSHNAWSGYSTPTAISTTTPTLTATGQDGKLLLVWPTNAPGFALQSSSDLSVSNWVPVLSPPVVVGGNNVVTNPADPADGESTFYRLNKP